MSDIDSETAAGRKLIVFADGTGNAFSQQESNIWRLYQILDRTQPDQKSIYIQGVGTSGNAIISKLDAVTGFGVPSNVRGLYSFLCWNWRPGDEIYMFGFSRGAFTIRSLAGLIASQGLMPRKIGHRLTTTAELNTNVMGAWRAYRSETAPFRWSHFLEDVKTLSPTVALARHLRDIVIMAWRKLMRRPLHSEVLSIIHEQQPERERGKIPIKFLGLFDTVEAYGLPIEEFRSVVNWAIWPISFRNRRCSPIVQSIRHALSLDDERTTFHPIRFDQSADMQEIGNAEPRTREIWFAGMHSDVGGGYADDSLALVPFSWMANEAKNAGLRLDLQALDRLQQRSSPLAQIHDSREGLAGFYRYDPRKVTSDPNKDGGPPIIHHGVAEKIVFGTGGYAPIVLPERINVLMADGRIEPIRGGNASTSSKSAPLQAQNKADEDAVDFLQTKPPRKSLVERVHFLILWRRMVYFLMMLATAAIALLPVLGPFFEGLLNPAHKNQATEQVKASVDTFIGYAGDWAGTFLPGFASPWINALRTYPLSALTCVILWGIFYSLNTMFHRLIRDYSHEAWVAHKGQISKLPSPLRFLFRLSTTLGVAPAWTTARTIFSKMVAPTVFIIAVVLLFGVGLSRTTISVLTKSGYLCSNIADDAKVLPLGKSFSKDGFSPASLCWSTDVIVQKGQTYTLWIDPDELFIDQTIVAEPGGFRSDSIVHYLTEKTLRRSIDGAWFQPIAQIGLHGDAVFLLEPADGHQPPVAHGFKLTTKLGWNQPWEKLQEPDLSRFKEHQTKAMQAQSFLETNRFVARFIAPADGPLYLYVNDVVPALPLFGPVSDFYENNAGKARVTVVRDPLPPAAEERNISQQKG